MIQIKKSSFKELYDLACEPWQKKFDEKFKNSLFSESLSFEENFLVEMEAACTAEQLPVFRKIFKKYLGEDLFSIITYSEVCKKLGIKEKTSKDYNGDERELAFHQVKNLEKLFNGNWKADLKDSSQHKYYPYFRVTSGGLVFLCVADDDFYYYGFAGLYKDDKTARHIGNNFAKIYEKLI